VAAFMLDKAWIIFSATQDFFAILGISLANGVGHF
jgi:hypothetical protein